MTDDGLTIGLLHQLARSGGTVIAKCLGAMRGIVLLSEIHPPWGRGRRVYPAPPEGNEYSPLRQAREWYGLLSDADLAELRDDETAREFLPAIRRIAERAAERGLRLVIRDFNNADFTGITLRSDTPFRFATFEALHNAFEVKRHCTVRHPVDQWASLGRYTGVPGPDIARFLEGYRRFAEHAVAIGFLHYEDFAAAPDQALRQLCPRLGLDFDPGWRDRWRTNDKVTGNEPARRRAGPIRPARRPRLGTAVLRRFETDENYWRSLSLLGYEPAGGTHDGP